MRKQGAWKTRVRSLKSNTYALYLAARDPRVPTLAKVIISIVVAYALSPIDLIPDFIPIIGYLDDFVLLPLGIWIALRMVPDEVWRECQALATEKPLTLSRNRTAALAILVIWAIGATSGALWVLSIMTDNP